MVSIGCYIPCRNDDANLGKCLNALMNQSLKPKQVVVLNDGSSDQVIELAKFYGLESVNLPPHKKSYVGSPFMAMLHNVALKILDQIDSYDYIFVLGADHILPSNYLEDLAFKTFHDGSVVSSGVIEDEKTREPRGSGRLIDYPFFKKEIGLRYPVNYGFETYLIYLALSLGYHYTVYPQITSTTLRKSSVKSRGKDMFALGYNWKYALGRCVLLFFKNPLVSIQTFFDWIIHKDVERYDLAEWVNEYQSGLFWERLKNFDF